MGRLPVLFLVALSCACCAEPEGVRASDVRVRVSRILVDENQLPVVVLEEQDGPRWLPIWIGTAEAHSIALQIGEQQSSRPNTHDLARRVIQGLDGKLERVVVNDLRRGTYFATLHLRTHDRRVEIDSRPSDAIAIALRAGAPIFVRARLFKEGGGGSSDEGAAGDDAEREI